MIAHAPTPTPEMARPATKALQSMVRTACPAGTLRVRKLYFSPACSVFMCVYVHV